MRLDVADYAQQVLGGVSFVPLIGQYGWPEDGPPATRA